MNNKTGRVTEIYDENRDSYGTGYLITDRLILTAHHVVAEEGKSGQIGSVYAFRLLGSYVEGEPFHWLKKACSLCWDSPKLDLALLKLVESQVPLSITAFLPPITSKVLFGKLGYESTVKAEGIGFPSVQQLEEKQNPEPLSGELSALAGMREEPKGQLRLQVTSPLPEKADQWKGISGTALFVKDYLVGVVTITNKGYKEKALWAAPISHVAHDPEFCRLVNGDPNVPIQLFDLSQSAVASTEEQTVLSMSRSLPMKLSRGEHEQFCDALRSAFPEKPLLELMISRQLDIQLNQITQDNLNYEITIYRVVQWAETNGRLKDLLEGSVRSNPGNPKLKAFADLWIL